VRAAFNSVDVINVREDMLVVRSIVRQRYIYRYIGILVVGFYKYGRCKQWVALACLIQHLHKLHDATLAVVCFGIGCAVLGYFARVCKYNAYTLVQVA